MKSLPVLVALLAAAVVACVVLQIRLISSQRALGAEIVQLDARIEAIPTAPAAPIVPVVSAKATDAQVIMDAIRVLERRGENDQLSYLVRTLRKIDADLYFKELTRLAAGPANERTVNLFENGGAPLTDKRYIPVFQALIDNLDPEGGNRPNQLMRLAAQMVGFDQDSFQPTIQTAARAWLDYNNRSGDSIDPTTARVLLASGDAQAHVAVLRSLRSQSYGDQRERTWTQLVDLYAEAHPFPSLTFDDRQNNEKNQAERAKVILPVEQWITENRRRLSYDRSRKTMVLAAAPAKAPEAVPVESAVPAAPVAPAAPKPGGF